MRFLSIETDQEGHWETRRIPKSLADRMDLNFTSAGYSRELSPPAAGVYRGVEQEQRALREGRHQTILVKNADGAEVTGRVLDGNGNPVAGATVTVLDPETVRDCTNCPWVISALDGSFRLVVRDLPHEYVVTAASGWAHQVTAVDKSGPTTIRLDRGRFLSFRLLDKDHQPILKGKIVGRRLLPGSNHEVELLKPLNSDSTGLIWWTNAPSLPLEVHATSPIHIRRKLSIPADAVGEQTVTLDPALIVQGQVTDEVSGGLVPECSVNVGCLVLRPAPIGVSNVLWQPTGTSMRVLTNATYRVAASPVMALRQDAVGVFVRFIADGYEPYYSELLRSNAGSVTLNPRMRRATSADVWILDPSSRPVPSARVALARSDSSLVLANGQLKLGSMAFLDQELFVFADERGLLRLSSDPYVTRYIVAEPAGFAVVPAKTALLNRRIDLQAWGAVRGTIWWKGQPAHGEIVLRDGVSLGLLSQPACKTSSGAALNADGVFSVERVIPGKHILQLRTPDDQDQFLGEVTVTPGDTATFDFRPGFRSVIARAIWPPQTSVERARRYLVLETQELPIMDKSIARHVWSPVPATQLAWMRQRRFMGEEASPGEYVFPQVPPGTYEIAAHIATGDGEAARIQSLGRRRVVVVEEDPNGLPFDAGDVDFSP